MNNKLSLTFILTPLLLAIWLTNCAHAAIRADWELIYDTELPFYILESDGDNLYAAGREGIHVSRTDGNTWHYREVGRFIDDFQILTIASGGGAVYVGAIGHGIYRSDDDGNTWHPKNEGLPPLDWPDGPDGSPWYSTVSQLLVTDSGVVIARGYRRGTWISRDRGESWDEVTMQWKVPQAPGEPDFPLGEAISTMTEFDGYLWAVSSNWLCRSRDEGDSWEMLRTPAFANFDYVYGWVELDNKLYAAGGRSFGRWNEAELIWEHLNRGLPVDVAMKELAVNRSRIFASLYIYELGVWLFDQSSETWAPVGPQKAKDVLVYSIVSHGSDLYAGTREGIYRASIPTIQRYGKLAVTWGAVKTK